MVDLVQGVFSINKINLPSIIPLCLQKFDGRHSSVKRLVENFEDTDADEAGPTIGSILENSGVTVLEAAHSTESSANLSDNTNCTLRRSPPALRAHGLGEKVGDVDSAGDLVPLFYVRLVSATRRHANSANVTAKRNKSRTTVCVLLSLFLATFSRFAVISGHVQIQRD